MMNNDACLLDQSFSLPKNAMIHPRYWEVGEYAKLTSEAEDFLDAVLNTDHIPYDIRKHKGYLQEIRNPVNNAKHKNLAGHIEGCHQWIDLYWSDYVYSPDMQLFFDCYKQHPFSNLMQHFGSTGEYDKGKAAYLYNHFIGFMRAEAVRCGVKKKLSDWRNNLGNQEDSIREYLDGLSRQYKHLVPIRLDLHYAESVGDESDAMERLSWSISEGGVWKSEQSFLRTEHGRPETRGRIDSRVALEDRQCFFGNRRGADRALFERMVGYISKLEQGGRHRAYHFHCVFLMDARGLTQEMMRQLKVGFANRWSDVTRGQGLVFDCHERTDKDAIQARGQWAIDPFDCRDSAQVDRFIDYVAGYMAKDDDQIVRVKPTPKARMLTMGR